MSFVSVKTATALLKCSRQNISMMIKRRTLKAFKKKVIRSQWMIPQNEIDRILNAR